MKSPYIRMLTASASTDITRYQLTGIHFDGEKWIATDGHRLLAVNDDQVRFGLNDPMTAKAGTTYEAKPFKDGYLTAMNCTYPNWKQLLPNRNGYAWHFKMHVPLWFKDVKVNKSPAIGINSVGMWTFGERLVTLNPAYLALLAVEENYLHVYNDDRLGPYSHAMA